MLLFKSNFLLKLKIHVFKLHVFSVMLHFLLFFLLSLNLRVFHMHVFKFHDFYLIIIHIFFKIRLIKIHAYENAPHSLNLSSHIVYICILNCNKDYCFPTGACNLIFLHLNYLESIFFN